MAEAEAVFAWCSMPVCVLKGSLLCARLFPVCEAVMSNARVSHACRTALYSALLCCAVPCCEVASVGGVQSAAVAGGMWGEHPLHPFLVLLLL